MAWFEEALDRLARGRVAVLGDLALDAYWILDAEHQERSIETGLPVHRVESQRYSPGGAANVIANLVDLGVSAVHAVGLVGEDLFGRELRRMLADRGALVDGLLLGGDTWQTLVFAKPHRDGAEQSRLDFGSRNVRSEDAGSRVLAEVERLAPSVDAFVLNQQVAGGVIDEDLVASINEIIRQHANCAFVVDSRDLAQRFRMAVVKINAEEAQRWLGRTPANAGSVAIDEVREMAIEIQRQTTRPVFLSHGAGGIVVADAGTTEVVPGIEIARPVDPVGAGDAVTATLAAVLGAGGDCLTAARLANLAAAVTVAKVGITGTASPDEIRALAQSQQGTV
ncbi:MAG: PfkB family carbohydrate kinase [Planctomycetota bacterium]|nr:PfkB family carbohydrate kinase [Planctomycetota bacterium]